MGQHHMVAAVNMETVLGELHLPFIVRYLWHRHILIIFIDYNDYLMLLNVLTLQSQCS